MNKIIQKLAVSVIEVESANTEKAVRQKLVEMGWTPPRDAKELQADLVEARAEALGYADSAIELGVYAEELEAYAKEYVTAAKDKKMVVEHIEEKIKALKEAQDDD